MAAFQTEWLEGNSPYRYHKCRLGDFCRSGCCGQTPAPDGSRILHYHPETGALAWFTLCRCPACGRYYIGLRGKWKSIENPLQYERQTDPCNLSGDMIP